MQERLTKVSESLKRARASERVLLEQVSYLDEVADDAETRKLLAQNPIMDREARLARSDRDRHAAQLADSRTEISRLVAERDRLLDRLLDLERTT